MRGGSTGRPGWGRWSTATNWDYGSLPIALGCGGADGFVGVGVHGSPKTRVAPAAGRVIPLGTRRLTRTTVVDG